LANANGKYVTADNGGASPLIANRTSVGTSEKFTVVDAGGGKIGLRAMANNKIVCADNNGANPLIANRDSVGAWESFTEVDAGGGKIALFANVNGKFVCADNAGANPLIANRTSFGAWETYTVGVISGSQILGLTASASASDGNGPPANAVDGNLTTRWATGANQIPGQWFQVDMGSGQSFSQVVLSSPNSSNDYPVGYNVNVSSDGVNWGSPVASGTGTQGVPSMTISFPAQTARYLRITQTGSTGNWWSIGEISVR
jgi:hypothetical protein